MTRSSLADEIARFAIKSARLGRNIIVKDGDVYAWINADIVRWWAVAFYAQTWLAARQEAGHE